ETVEIDGKKIKVLVGKMHLVPSEINRVVFHEGSASVASKYYKGLNISEGIVKDLARQQASLVDDEASMVARASKKIVSGKIAKGISSFVGRSVRTVIPLIGSGIAILEFAENAEAHGVGGAVARAVPVLGDLISAHDLGSDLAKQITDEANAALAATYKAHYEEVADAWDRANAQTIAAFNDLAPQIKVTNDGYDTGFLVDAEEITDALKVYRGRMQEVNLLERTKPGFDSGKAAAQAK